MREALVAMSVITYSAAMSACEKGAWWQAALGLFWAVLERRMERDVISHNAVISVCEKKAFYGEKLDAYFAAHGIEYKKLVYSGNEVDKDISDVERILVDLRQAGQGRQEPASVVGGGVTADLTGFATA